MKRAIALSVASVAAAATVLAGCSSSGDSSHGGGHSSSMSMNAPSSTTGSGTAQAGAPASGPHNDSDLMFASNMIMHHRQAVEMADMALMTFKNSGLLSLAKQIKAAQGPEIVKMTGWLNGWNAPVPSGSTGHGMDHEGMHMQGMMSAEDMAKLSKATGTEFDKMWLSMMIEHHKGAVSMSKTVLAEGQNTDTEALAKTIISTQNTEITQMNTLLAGL